MLDVVHPIRPRGRLVPLDRLGGDDEARMKLRLNDLLARDQIQRIIFDDVLPRVPLHET
jgi:hypothetical protein